MGDGCRYPGYNFLSASPTGGAAATAACSTDPTQTMAFDGTKGKASVSQMQRACQSQKHAPAAEVAVLDLAWAMYVDLPSFLPLPSPLFCQRAAGTIVAKATGMCLDGTCATVGTGGCDPVPFVPCDGSPAQSWTLDPTTHHVVNGEFGRDVLLRMTPRRCIETICHTRVGIIPSAMPCKSTGGCSVFEF